jgi:hypothetical protein
MPKTGIVKIVLEPRKKLPAKNYGGVLYKSGW